MRANTSASIEVTKSDKQSAAQMLSQLGKSAPKRIPGTVVTEKAKDAAFAHFFGPDSTPPSSSYPDSMSESEATMDDSSLDGSTYGSGGETDDEIYDMDTQPPQFGDNDFDGYKSDPDDEAGSLLFGSEDNDDGFFEQPQLAPAPAAGGHMMMYQQATPQQQDQQQRAPTFQH